MREVSDEDNFEWACFNFTIDNGVEKMVCVSPYDPGKMITYKNADQFTTMSRAIETLEMYDLDGIITREALEHITYITLKHLSNVYSEDKRVAGVHLYSDIDDLEQIISAIKDHYKRCDIAIFNDEKRDVISQFLLENFNGKVEDKIYTYKDNPMVTRGSYQ